MGAEIMGAFRYEAQMQPSWVATYRVYQRRVQGQPVCAGKAALVAFGGLSWGRQCRGLRRRNPVSSSLGSDTKEGALAAVLRRSVKEADIWVLLGGTLARAPRERH